MLHCTDLASPKPIETETKSQNINFSAYPIRCMTGRIELTINIDTTGDKVDCTICADPKTAKPFLYHGEEQSGSSKFQIQRLFAKINSLITDDLLKRHNNPEKHFTKINIFFNHDPSLNMTARIVSNNKININAVHEILQNAEKTTNKAIKEIDKHNHPSHCIIS